MHGQAPKMELRTLNVVFDHPQPLTEFCETIQDLFVGRELLGCST